MNNNNYVVFGTGSSAFSFVRSFNDVNILFFLDNDESKQYVLYNKKPVLPPEILKITDNLKYTIIIASEYYDQISKQLSGYSLKENMNYVYMKTMLLDRSDYFIISYMKCGRTWLRYLIGLMIEEQLSLNFEDKLIYTDCYEYKQGYPIITAYHDDNPHRKGDEDLVKEKYEYNNNKIIFMVRHPGDVAVSLYYHMKYRSKQYNGDIDTFVVRKVQSIVNYYNIWYFNKGKMKDFILVRYEDMHSKALNVITSINTFLGFNKLSDEAAERVIHNSSFKNMKKYEMETKSENTQLNNKLAFNEKGAKIRKGKVKGYTDELKSETIQKIEKYINKNLNSFYGY